MPRNANRSGKRVTIHEVAAAAGISYGTVSRVINDAPYVKPETRQRVREAMDRLGYSVDRRARSLAGGRAQVLAVLVPDLGTGYIGEIIRGIDAEVELAQYDLLLYTTHRQAAKETSYVANIARGMADGLVLVLPSDVQAIVEAAKETSYVANIARGMADGLVLVLPSDVQAIVEHLRQIEFPFVLVDYQGVEEQVPAVCATNWQGAYNATEYLIDLGHRRIGFITGDMEMAGARNRLAGYQAALRTHHLPGDPALVRNGEFHYPEGYSAALALLGLPNPPTAIFASNDDMALATLDALRGQGVRVPEDMSVMGFDGIPQAALVHPPLTTVAQPLAKMGRVATQMLLDQLNDPGKPVRRVELPTELIVRGSCRSLHSSNDSKHGVASPSISAGGSL
jgi:LacI family transcriptional regulator